MKRFLCALFILPTLSLSKNNMAFHSLSDAELTELETRLKTFYEDPSPAALQVRSPKFSVKDGAVRHPHANLKGKKGEPYFYKRYCEKTLKRHFKGIRCDEENFFRDVVKADDRFEDLAQTWVQNPVYDLDVIPTEGRSNLPLWSDDYWRTKWGLTSYRYSAYVPADESKTYAQMIALYEQPSAFLSLLTKPMEEVEKTVISYSPSEKYDLTVGDPDFTLTLQQKKEGEDLVGHNQDVEEWMGLCHGWAPASIMVDRPLKPVTVTGTKGAKVTWYGADLKAMLTLLWSNGDYGSNFVGGRCGSKRPRLYPNGRIKNPECFDSNPATFHLALGNIMGIEKASFVIDQAFDYEVWNQPLVSYEMSYFNPLDVNKRSKKWSDVAVDYDAAFKSKDRFQRPLTRGPNVEKVVGVVTTIVYVSELSPPKHTPDPEADQLLRMTMTYDLELTTVNGKLVPTGGEWHENSHPDFLWVPKKQAYAWMDFDKKPLAFTGEANENTRVSAKLASPEGYPLCQVLSHLLEKSTDGKSLRCLPQVP